MYSTLCYLTDSRNVRVSTPKEHQMAETNKVDEAVAAVTGGVAEAPPKGKAPAKKGAKKKPAAKAVKKAAKKAVKAKKA